MSETVSPISVQAIRRRGRGPDKKPRRGRPRPSNRKKVDPTIALIRERNLDVVIAKELSVSRQAVSQWKKVPWNRVLKISSITGRPPHLIRPDIYPAPPTVG